MEKRKSKNEEKKKIIERGISPSKVAYAYGVSMETLKKWIDESERLQFNHDEEFEYAQENYVLNFRKWTPKQLQKVFDEFGDPRDYKEIIDSYEI